MYDPAIEYFGLFKIHKYFLEFLSRLPRNESERVLSASKVNSSLDPFTKLLTMQKQNSMQLSNLLQIKISCLLFQESLLKQMSHYFVRSS